EVKRQQETRPRDEVRIMTVHGAKGLEAPVVILADTVGVPDLKRERVFTVRDEGDRLFPVIKLSEFAKRSPVYKAAIAARRAELQAEYHRLLYVALTRARDELHVFGMQNAKGRIDEDSWYPLLARTLRELGAREKPDGSITLRDRPAGHGKAATP